ncbi:MAG: hypothetical protein AB1465_06385, partial [Patescibacteria group bacterium]
LPRNKTELIAKLPEIFYILGLIFVIIGGYCAMIVPYDTFRNLNPGEAEFWHSSINIMGLCMIVYASQFSIGILLLVLLEWLEKKRLDKMTFEEREEYFRQQERIQEELEREQNAEAYRYS